MKTCLTCKQTKPLVGFVKQGSGYRNICKNCHNKKAKTYRVKNPEAVKNSKLKQTLGVTLADKNKMIEKQKGRCPICKINLKDAKFTPVDHCHTTGKIRGVLCGNCNVGIGHLKDSLMNLFRAAMYLVKNRFQYHGVVTYGAA